MEAARARLNYQMALAECSQMKQALEQQKQQLEVLRSVVSNVESTCLGDRISNTARVIIFYGKYSVCENMFSGLLLHGSRFMYCF